MFAIRFAVLAFSLGLLLLLAIPNASIALSSGSNGEASASYVSVRALDHYGNAVQLSHAKEAARRYGRPVLVAVVEGTEQDKAQNNSAETKASKCDKEQSTTSSSFFMVVSLGTAPILHPLQLPLQEANESDSPLPMLAMCFTGVKGDANWLLKQLQQHVAEVWERYGISAMSSPAIAHVIARLLGRFAGQPEKKEWQSSLGLPGKRDEDNRQSSWSRPLGVQTMILSLGSDASDLVDPKHHPGLLIVEPSGRILKPSVQSESGKVSLATMGKGSDKLNEHLGRLLRGESQVAMGGNDSPPSLSWEDQPPTYDECQDALIRILLEEITSTSNVDENNGPSSRSPGGEIMVETYSLEGKKIERRLFRYDNANTTYEPI